MKGRGHRAGGKGPGAKGRGQKANGKGPGAKCWWQRAWGGRAGSEGPEAKGWGRRAMGSWVMEGTAAFLGREGAFPGERGRFFLGIEAGGVHPFPRVIWFACWRGPSRTASSVLVGLPEGPRSSGSGRGGVPRGGGLGGGGLAFGLGGWGSGPSFGRLAGGVPVLGLRGQGSVPCGSGQCPMWQWAWQRGPVPRARRAWGKCGVQGALTGKISARFFYLVGDCIGDQLL